MFNYFLFILGCQFNYYDAEKLALALDGIGGAEVLDAKDADVAIIFACSVRQKAADRILGHIRNWKKKNPKPKVIVTACVLPADNKMISKFADLIVNEKDLLNNYSQILENLRITSGSSIGHKKRSANHQLYNSKTAYVTITAGCNNFCTYCAVPYTRGRETSKPAPIILSEVNALVKSGINHIILLGQNVNSYGLSDYHPRDIRKNKSQKGTRWTKHNPSPFVKLLREVDGVDGVKEITFLSPNPQDMSADLVDWMRNSSRFSKNLNLPMQSGSTRILKAMNRRYSRTEYLTLVRTIRTAVPDIYLSTDIIVGFPGETESDFQKTVDAVNKCRFDKAFVSIYSPRPGTASAMMADDISFTEKKRRWEIINSLINK
jgi:tRNA-2-methylthio-N6-dimethylallyladenosine synthase